ncbi:hypothetical protein FNV43_RR13171 [Rhamnella rubrinervis]|uniref:Secreted protein n=1 Tax=Rhamnella rubrinervis TaxID=2594499 RepID=A0A8K0H0R0_9ROSA|nr:hypothetical protein FNV43_RR13171 [Rhamnella rubrinervis]
MIQVGIAIVVRGILLSAATVRLTESESNEVREESLVTLGKGLGCELVPKMVMVEVKINGNRVTATIWQSNSC